MLRLVMSSCVVLSLVGCSKLGNHPIPSAPVDMTFQSGFDASTVDRMDLVTVRAYRRGDGESNTAICNVSGTQFSAEFTTPAMLRLPLFRGRTDSVAIRCNDQAGATTLRGHKNVEAKNLSAPENEGITIGLGTGGTRIGALFSIRNRDNDRFNYSNTVSIRLR